MKGFDSVEGFGGLGAFLSGIFAPLALLWFYKSYRIQSNELKLQREELALQRKALEQSVLAQEGSETALKEQSEAMQAQLSIIEKQLEITEYQFETAIEEKNINRPKFFVEVTDIQLGQICDSNFNRKNIQITIEYLNKRGKADIRDIECMVLRQNHINSPIAKFLDQQLFIVTWNANNLTINSNFSLHDLAREQIMLGNYVQDGKDTGKLVYVMRKILMDILILCQLSIYYDSIRTGMGVEKYNFYIFNQAIILSKSSTQTISMP
tara:strand:+ start:390 stop:1187 length:798 start_codon:yes stop_codon:yes gene_type:complete